MKMRDRCGVEINVICGCFTMSQGFWLNNIVQNTAGKHVLIVKLALFDWKSPTLV